MIGLHLQQSSIVPIEHLLREPFIDIVVYPSSSVEIAKDRVKEIESIGVKGILFEGKSIVNGLHILGKGCTSIVVKAVLDKNSSVKYSVRNGSSSRRSSSNNISSRSLDDACNEMVVALKMMRTDSGRISMEHEARMLAIANGVGIGPRLIAYSRNLLAMELIDGMHMIEFVREFGNGSDSSNSDSSSDRAKDRVAGNHNYYANKDNCNNYTYVKSILKDILEQCFLLDSIGLDHGELGRMDRHVIIGSKACIIDFESSSMSRRVTNVTSAANYLLFGKGRAVADTLGLCRDRSRIVDALRMYRLDMCKERFNELLTLLGLKFYKESSACR
ncbi:hypothetical protein HRbin04_00004 [archaeon HR04]|nr:hypothetical protein HRbin04_00004 [archaeon HR04]